MTPKDFTIGQAVEILEGEHQGLVGQIMGHDWDEEKQLWQYLVGKDYRTFGPYTREQLG